MDIFVAAPTPREVSVYLTAEARMAFDQGDYHGLDALNEELGVGSISRNRYWGHPDLTALIIKFTQPYKSEYLQARYDEAAGVKFASPEGLIFIGGPFGLRLEDPRAGDGAEYRTYRFQFGSGDCPAGCILRWTVDVEVSDNGVIRYPAPNWAIDLGY